MPFNIGPVELIIVLIIALLVVGPRRLPEMGQAVGKTIREFRKASSDVSEAVSLEPQTKPKDATPPTTLRGEATPNTISQDVTTAPAAEARRDDQ